MNNNNYECYLCGKTNENKLFIKMFGYVIFQDKNKADEFVEKNYKNATVRLSGIKATKDKWFETFYNNDSVITFI